MLSSRPDTLVARVAIDGTNSKDDPSTASPIGSYGCARDDPLLGEAEEAAELALTRTSASRASSALSLGSSKGPTLSGMFGFSGFDV